MKKAFCAFLFVCLAASGKAQSSGVCSHNELESIRLSPLNYALFALPALTWNLAFTKRLDMSAFSGSVPVWFETVEWIFRMGALLYPALLPIDVKRTTFAPGLIVFCAGTILYFASWLPYMGGSVPGWAEVPLFRFAPAYLPLVWLGGISLMSGSYIHSGISIVFIGLHVGEHILRFRSR